MNFEKLQNKIKLQLNQLYNTLKSLNIKQDITTLRMHYLNKDFTLGYSDYVGFRCGTCHSYPGYDLINKKIFNIKIEPLIIMDCTLFDYMELNYEQAYNIAIDIKRKCQKINDQFNILWHNSYFQNHRQKTLYQDLLIN